MTIIKKQTNISKLISAMEYYSVRYISKDQLLDIITKLNIKSNPNTLIYKMILGKHIVVIKQNTYLYIPISSIDRIPQITEYELNEAYLGENEKYYIGLWNAYNYYGFTTQVSNKLFVFNKKINLNKKILSKEIKYIKVSNNYMFGITKDKYPLSDKEKTIIDILNYFKDIGNLKDIILEIKKHSFDVNKLITYGKETKSIKMLKLIGIITDNLDLYNYLKSKNKLSYYTYIRGSTKKEIYPKWKLKLI
ncbi:MAG: hypothetical protein WCF78_02640 [archaeon]